MNHEIQDKYTALLIDIKAIGSLLDQSSLIWTKHNTMQHGTETHVQVSMV